MLKRGFDISFSLIVLFLLAPLFLIIAILIKIDSRGTVFYQGDRVGKNGRLFKLLKFRTMEANADRIGPPITCQGDARITRMGAILRRTKLDELPQLENVLWGDMTLVGPRPEVPYFVKYYSPPEREVLKIRPGMTGLTWVQLYQKAEEEDMLPGNNWEQYYIDILMPRKLALDMEYVKNHSFWLDIKIILQTILILLRKLMNPTHS